MIIALYGEKRVGKDTTADIIKKYFPTFQRVAFADIPKEIISKTFGITKEQFDDLKNTNEVYRQYLVNFAETMKKYFGNDIWAKLAINSEDNILITDLRFKEEYDYIKKYNPIIIHIVDKNINEKHIHKLPYDYEIDNTEKDLIKLEEKILKIFKNFTKNT